MKLFKMENWQLQVEDSAWGLAPFKKLLDRDKSKDKEIALKDMLFIYYYTDIKSDYMYITDSDKRVEEIIRDLEYPKEFKIDADLKVAIDFYKERSTTIVQSLYQSAIKAADAVSRHLEKADYLLSERDNHGKVTHKIGDITKGLKDIKNIMQDLKAAEKELIKEQKETEGRKKGSQEMGMFEDGL